MLIVASVGEDVKFFIVGEFKGNMKDAAKKSKTLEMAQFLKEGFGTMDDKILVSNIIAVLFIEQL